MANCGLNEGMAQEGIWSRDEERGKAGCEGLKRMKRMDIEEDVKE